MAINKNFVIKHGVEVNTKLLVGDANTQKVGIGTTVPQYSLHVGGLRGGIGASDVYVSGITTVRDLHVTGITTFDTGRVLIGAGASTGTVGQILHVGSATTEGGVYISGDVGLGVTLPGAKLNVVPGSSAIAGLFSGTTEKDMVRITQLGGGNALRVDDIASDASPFVITGIGSVGIGTTNPKYALVVDSLVSTGTTALFVHGDAQITGDLIVDDFSLDELSVDQINVTGILTSAQTNLVGTTTAVNLNIIGVTTLTSIGSNLIPDGDGTRNIGAAGSEWQDLHIDGTANIDVLDVDNGANIAGGLVANSAQISDLTDNRVVIVGGSGELEDSGNLTFDGSTLAVTGDQTVSGKITVGSGASIHANGNLAVAGVGTINGGLIVGAGATFTGNILPEADGTRDIGASGLEWKDLYIDGTANIDALLADTAKIGDLTDNRIVIAGGSGELEDDANFTFDGSKLNVGVGGTTLTAISNATLGIGGSVGVGTDDPGYLLEVHSPVTSGQTALYVRGDMVVTGDINIDDISIGDLNVSGISTFVGNIIIGTGATVGFGSTAYFKDHAKAIFGDGEDLKIYHDGSNSYISDTGTGGLIVGSNSLTIKNAALNETQAVFTENGAVELYHDNGKRFNTNAICLLYTSPSPRD